MEGGESMNIKGTWVWQWGIVWLVGILVMIASVAISVSYKKVLDRPSVPSKVSFEPVSAGVVSGGDDLVWLKDFVSGGGVGQFCKMMR